MANQALEVMLREAETIVEDLARTRVIGMALSDDTRFVLFQSSMSLCSQKVRSVLVHKNVPFVQHDLIIICFRDSNGELHPAEHYKPPYVRLRMSGGGELNDRPALGWRGITSVRTEGFDACVVPTLVDRQAGKVVVDSARIIEYIDAETDPRGQLLPQACADEVRRQVEIVDQTPHGVLLAGFDPDDDRRPDVLKAIMLNYHVDKLKVLEKLIEENQHDHALVAAYRAKITKEEVGELVCHDDEAMRAGRRDTMKILDGLEADLGQKANKWLASPDISLADLLWGVSLFRMKYLGLESLWQRLPRVSAYFAELMKLPAVRTEAVEATVHSLPPSDYVDADIV